LHHDPERAGEHDAKVQRTGYSRSRLNKKYIL